MKNERDARRNLQSLSGDCIVQVVTLWALMVFDIISWNVQVLLIQVLSNTISLGHGVLSIAIDSFFDNLAVISRVEHACQVRFEVFWHYRLFFFWIQKYRLLQQVDVDSFLIKHWWIIIAQLDILIIDLLELHQSQFGPKTEVRKQVRSLNIFESRQLLTTDSAECARVFSWSGSKMTLVPLFNKIAS